MAAVAAPAVALRAVGVPGPAPLALVVFGAAVVAASFLLAWAAEAAQVDISGGLAIALLALIAVLPEYAVDMYFAYTAGHDPSYAQWAAANMTGSNRLLLGLGWPVVAFVAMRAMSKRTGRPMRALLLSRRRRVELAFLGVAGVLAFVMPATRQIHLGLAVVLLGVFAAYLWRVSRSPVTEPELLGTPARLATLPRRRRRLVVASMAGFAAVVVLAAAEPFAHALVDTGAQLGIDRFLLVQWLAPLASEAPEFIVAILLARRGNGDDALGTLLSSKVNQWTLLIGGLPIAYLAGGGGLALHLDARQVEEVLLTAAQTALGFAVLLRLRLPRWAAVALLGLFLVQFALPGTTARLVVSAVYGALALGALVVNRRGLVEVTNTLADMLPWRRSLQLARRVSITLVGGALLVVGAAMLVAPGPGLLVLVLALLVLGTEYEWARRQFHRHRERASLVARRAAANRLALTASTAFGLVAVALGVVLIAVDTLPGSGVVSGATVAVGGVAVLATLAYSVVADHRAGRGVSR